MRYLKTYKIFESVDNFPDVFNNTLMRGVKVDKDEFIDNPKTRKVSIGSVDYEDYRVFLTNYANLGIPDPTKSVHMYFKPDEDLSSMIRYYGTSYRIIPEKGALFGFNKELRNGGLGSTWFFPDRTAKDFLNKSIDSEFPSYDDKESFMKAITKYQQDLIDGGVIGVLTYDELLKMSNEEIDTLQVWTESPCLHKKYTHVKQPKDPKSYKNQPVLTKDDFINLGIEPKRIPEFYQSEFGKKIKGLSDDIPFDDRREESLMLLNNWLKTYESMADLASDSYHKRQERLRTLEDMSLELWDDNFNVQVSSEVLSRDDKYIVVNIVKTGSLRIDQRRHNRFDYSEIKDVFLSMVSYMESEGHSISIDVSDKYVSNLIPVELKGDELCLKHRVSRIDGSYLMVDYPIGQLIIKFKE